MIEELVKTSFNTISKRRQAKPNAQQPTTSSPDAMGHEIPTLRPDVYRESSPMLSERYGLFGRWTVATHGHWLSLTDMKNLWNETGGDETLDGIRHSWIAARENWSNDASALFRPERLSLFAGHDNNYERVYLLWLDCVDEPEVWAYDSNGESRYRNLAEYLRAYLNEDISAASKAWRA